MGIYPSSPPDLRPLCNSLPLSCLCESLLQLKPRLRQQYQVICIKQLPWQTFFEIVSYGLHYYVKQDWAKYRALMHPNLDLKTFTLFTIPFDRCNNPIIQTLITFTIQSSTPTCLRAHHKTSRGTLSKAFSKSTKDRKSVV